MNIMNNCRRYIKIFTEFLLTSDESESSSDDEFELRRHKKPRTENYIPNVVEHFTDKEFRENFRMNRRTFEHILNIIKESISTSEVDKGLPSYDAKTQLLVAIWYFATPDSYRSICCRFNIGKATGLRIVRRVTNALIKLSPSVISWPNDDYMQTVINGFALMGFPNTIGCVDGSYIPIPLPKDNGISYICRKNFPSIILQGTCDHRLLFTHCYAGEVGSLHDANVLRRNGYDFIIIGSGSAGSVIANRLSEIGSWNILLLEAGYLENSLTEYPILAPLLHLTDYNWGYVTEPQKKMCLAAEDRRCTWPRGKALGGSTVVNYMIYTRGNPEDYNRWAALGNPGWSYEEVLPYFLKSEDSHLKTSNKAYHNKGGYLSVSEAFSSELGNAFVEAGQELGYKSIDYNSPEQIGFSKLQATIKQGRRHSVASAFLRPILHRKNLKISTDTTVLRILIDPFTNRAYGVEYKKGNKKYIVKAKKEVILSAGAVNSPQLLMLSGVGPKIYLKELGITTFSDLPVGQTMYEHVGFPGLVIYTNFTDPKSTPNFNPLQLLQWYASGDGPISSAAGFEALGFIATNVSKKNDYPDIELVLRTSSLISDNGIITSRILRISEDYYREMYSSLPRGATFSLVPVLLHPKSNGYLTLNSSDPYGYPLIHANYFTDPQNLDVKTLTASIRFIQKLCQTDAFKKFNAQISDKHFVRCKNLPYDSDQYWHCALSYMSAGVFHPIATCKMGPVDDPTAVVNNELRVYGIRNLRVADASVIPVTLSAHTNAPTIMVGEMASDIIKREWGAL